MQCFYFASPVRGEGRFVKQSGPPGRFAHVVLELETSPVARRGALRWEASEAEIPTEFRAAVSRALNRLFEKGSPFAGHLADGLVIRVVGGTSHPTDSNALSFEIATVAAFRNAVGHSPDHSAKN